MWSLCLATSVFVNLMVKEGAYGGLFGCVEAGRSLQHCWQAQGLDITIVMAGSHTQTAPGVQAEGKPCVSSCTTQH